jgi:DNA-binding beta-propeller fold protein YncE
LLSDSSLTVVCAVTNVVLAHFQIDPALHILFGPVFSRNGKFAYVVGQFPQTMSDTAELEVISTATRKVVARTEIGPFEYPQSLAISRDGKKLYVSSENAAAGPNNLVGEVSTFSARTGKLLTALQIPTGTVQSLTVPPDGREVYGILEPFSSPFCSTVMIIDPATDNLIDRVPLGEIAYNLQFTPSGRAYWLNGVTLSNQESFLEARSRERNRIIHKIESLPGATNPGFDVFVIEPMARDHQPSRPRGATELAPSD